MVKILSIGAAVQDVFLSNSEDFQPVSDHNEWLIELKLGAKADVNAINFSTGGGATNASVTFARQGLESEFVGLIGDDPAGVAVMNDLDKEGVVTHNVKISQKYNTGYSVLLLAPSGERTILTYRGASTHYQLEDFDFDKIDANWLYLSSMSGQISVLENLVSQAKKHNVKVMLNPGKGELRQREKLLSILKDVDVLLVNKEEMQQLLEADATEELAMRGANLVKVAIVSDGPNGVSACDGRVVVNAGMYEDVPVIDRTGAGDAFGSGFLSQWSQGKSLKDSIVFASANSTSVVTEIGAKTAILHKGVKLHDMPITEKEV